MRNFAVASTPYMDFNTSNTEYTVKPVSGFSNIFQDLNINSNKVSSVDDNYVKPNESYYLSIEDDGFSYNNKLSAEEKSAVSIMSNSSDEGFEMEIAEVTPYNNEVILKSGKTKQEVTVNRNYSEYITAVADQLKDIASEFKKGDKILVEGTRAGKIIKKSNELMNKLASGVIQITVLDNNPASVKLKINVLKSGSQAEKSKATVKSEIPEFNFSATSKLRPINAEQRTNIGKSDGTVLRYLAEQFADNKVKGAFIKRDGDTITISLSKKKSSKANVENQKSTIQNSSMHLSKEDIPFIDKFVSDAVNKNGKELKESVKEFQGLLSRINSVQKKPVFENMKVVADKSENGEFLKITVGKLVENVKKLVKDKVDGNESVSKIHSFENADEVAQKLKFKFKSDVSVENKNEHGVEKKDGINNLLNPKSKESVETKELNVEVTKVNKIYKEEDFFLNQTKNLKEMILGKAKTGDTKLSETTHNFSEENKKANSKILEKNIEKGAEVIDDDTASKLVKELKAYISESKTKAESKNPKAVAVENKAQANNSDNSNKNNQNQQGQAAQAIKVENSGAKFNSETQLQANTSKMSDMEQRVQRLERLIRGVSSNISRLASSGQKQSSMILSLNPKSMGKIKILLTNKNGEMDISFEFSKADTQKLMSGAKDELIDILKEKGVNITNLDMKTKDQNGNLVRLFSDEFKQQNDFFDRNGRNPHHENQQKKSSQQSKESGLKKFVDKYIFMDLLKDVV